MKKRVLITIMLALFAMGSWAQKITKVEPLNWWVGMKHPLQLIIYG